MKGDIYDNFIKWYDSYSERPSKYTIAGHFTREVKREKQAVAKEILDVIDITLFSGKVEDYQKLKIKPLNYPTAQKYLNKPLKKH